VVLSSLDPAQSPVEVEVDLVPSSAVAAGHGVIVLQPIDVPISRRA
jgi:hypothetical protein